MAWGVTAAVSRRSLLGSAAAMAAGALLGACGRARPGGATPTTLLLEGTGQVGLFAQMIPEFEAQHPGVRVQWGLTSFNQAAALRDQLLASVGPDVLWVQDPGPYLAGDLLLPLDGLIRDAGYALTDFPPRLLGAVSQAGHLYGLPRSAATGAYMVNVGLVNAAQASVPGPDYTADEMAALWDRLTRSGIVGGQLAWSPAATFYFNGWGGHLVDPADPRRCLLDSAPDLACGEWMYGRLRQDGSAQGLQGQQSSASFTNGSLVMQVVTAAGALSAAAQAGSFSWTFLPFPAWPKGRATFVQVDAYAISAATRHPHAAWELLQFVSSPAWQRQAMATGVPPARLPLWPQYIRALERAAPPMAGRGLDAFFQPLQEGWAYPPERFAENSAASAVLDQYWQDIYGPTGHLPVRQGFRAAAAAVDKSQASPA